MIHDRIVQLTRKYTEHDMLSLYAELPAFPEARIRLLVACLQAHSKKQEHHELFATVVALVQMGLDTHDRIDTNPSQLSEREMRARQLNVLGGDYYSSRFYNLLAQAGQVSMVRKLSEAVCEVNRLKMNFYSQQQEKRLSPEQYIAYGASIKSELFRRFGEIMDERLSSQWNDLLITVSRCETIHEEWKRARQLQLNSWGYWYIMQEGTNDDKQLLLERANMGMVQQTGIELASRYRIAVLLEGMLTQQVEQFKAVIEHMTNSQCAGELNSIADSFLQSLAAPVMHSETR
ncbi:heptaprenyl diphosphate synthase [Paenibacillus cellulosilyticus]|uniref:Heptaprenyl diphosphate synthase n=1 Tax=Paenibacillus cellulosilyticus TaxID=375489 RepID=A0A2V2YWU3_9BACL|nr:heptaprenyl diphosphate synthase component 1 [Paenibacillus cellulosilyticus]PWW05555.1 heptaprenyl diphosphate synthase [Paenibacillus cellulosilyticus]QKS45409.1 heptaprenyl diphosphate synthase component 1 [Paenibacillus cellulosilyticus]